MLRVKLCEVRGCNRGIKKGFYKRCFKHREGYKFKFHRIKETCCIPGCKRDVWDFYLCSVHIRQIQLNKVPKRMYNSGQLTSDLLEAVSKKVDEEFLIDFRDLEEIYGYVTFNLWKRHYEDRAYKALEKRWFRRVKKLIEQGLITKKRINGEMRYYENR